MPTFFLVCALVGGGLVVVQLATGLLGFDHAGPHELHAGHPADAHGAAASGLQLTSLRALAAGAAFFGLTGFELLRAGWAAWLVALLAVGAGLVAMLVVALLLRTMLRFETDGTVRIENALWLPGTVYVPIPGAQTGAGKITLSVQGRLVEYQAVTREAALPTGTDVTVVDVVSPDTLEVVRTPNVLEGA